MADKKYTEWKITPVSVELFDNVLFNDYLPKIIDIFNRGLVKCHMAIIETPSRLLFTPSTWIVCVYIFLWHSCVFFQHYWYVYYVYQRINGYTKDNIDIYIMYFKGWMDILMVIWILVEREPRKYIFSGNNSRINASKIDD